MMTRCLRVTSSLYTSSFDSLFAQLPLTLGQHYFYGNIPKLLEVLFAEAIAVSGGFELAHVVHLLIAVAFLVTHLCH